MHSAVIAWFPTNISTDAIKTYWELGNGKQAKGNRLCFLCTADTLAHIFSISLRFLLLLKQKDRGGWRQDFTKEGGGKCTKEKDLRQSPALSSISSCQLCSRFSMQDFLLKFLLTVSSSPGKTNSNNPRINRIIHHFLILISHDVIFILKYYPARGSLWKPKTPLK